MLALFTVLALVVNVAAVSIGSVSDTRNVTKRDAGDLFPDWVPFKNKHGEELGEFVQVPKRKPKKRLALPANFVLKAVADYSDDDFDKSPGEESDNDDYFEKKDWSDVNRSTGELKKNDEPLKLNHTDLSDIDGVVNIIKGVDSDFEKERQVQRSNEQRDAIAEVEVGKPKHKKDLKSQRYEDDIDYEESDIDKRKRDPVEDEQNEAKKVSILDSVDDLKERHAEEQKAISERIKEEAIYQEEREREKIQAQLSQDFNDKYADRYGRKPKKLSPDYDDYDDKSVPLDEKYGQVYRKPKSTTNVPKKVKSVSDSGKLSVFKNPQLYMIYDDDYETTTTMSRTTKYSTQPNSISTAKTKTEPTSRNIDVDSKRDIKHKPQRYSSKYSSTTPRIEFKERISLVPETTGKDEEPALFFPKKRKNKNRKNSSPKKSKQSTSNETTSEESTSKKPSKVSTSNKTTQTESTAKESTSNESASNETTQYDTTPNETTEQETTANESTSSETTEPVYSTIVDTTASESVLPESTVSDLSGPTADAQSSDIEAVTVTDAVPAPSDHKAREKKDENFHKEKGGGRQYSSSHEEEHSEEGKKAYEGVHKETKAAKGHHDKENHSGEYDDHGGVDKHHEEESGHYGDHHHEEHGKKNAKYEELGKHSKGHSTKGSHDIHKKEEYEKNVEFFEEDGDSDEEEKHGGFNHEHGHSKGGHFKHGKYNGGHAENTKGESGHFGKSGHLHTNKGHKSAGGHEGHGKHGQNHFNKNGKASGKKWIYYHGYPAKNANLVRIDRIDHQQHLPYYYAG